MRYTVLHHDVPTAFVNLLESPTRARELTAVVRFAYARATVGAVLTPGRRRAGDAHPPGP